MGAKVVRTGWTIFQRKPIGDHFNPTFVGPCLGLTVIRFKYLGSHWSIWPWLASDWRACNPPLYGVNHPESTVSRTHSEQFTEFFGLSLLHRGQFHSTMKVNASAISSCRVAFAEGVVQSTSAEVVSAGSEVPELSPVGASHDPQGCLLETLGNN